MRNSFTLHDYQLYIDTIAQYIDTLNRLSLCNAKYIHFAPGRLQLFWRV